MAGSSAQPVAMDDLLQAKLNLEIAVRRLESAIDIMARHGINSILMRSRTSLTRGVSGVYAMATEAHNRAEDATVSAQLGLQTRAANAKERYNTYGKKKKSL